MSSIFSDGALHPGRDPSDAWWYVLHRPEDWDGPAGWPSWQAVYDGTRLVREDEVVELMPLPLAAAGAAYEVTGPDGTWYGSRTADDAVVMQGPCDAAPIAVGGLRGSGDATGELRSPHGLALDEHGWLYVADTGNHRVQVVAPAEGRVVAVLMARGMDAPVLVAVGDGRIYVYDRGGTIFVFDRRFQSGPALRLTRSMPAGPVAIVPIAIAVDRDGLLVVADAGWSRLLRFGCDGSFVDEVAIGDVPALAPLAAAARFAPEGTVIAGPFDGGLDGTPWHQVAVDATFPAGTAITVQTYCADDAALPAVAPWAPEAPVAMPLAGLDDGGERVRPVLSDVARWRRVQASPMRARTSPLALLAGTGPAAHTSILHVPAVAARALRPGDDVQLDGAITESATIASISPRVITLYAWGDRVSFAAGATVTLLERDGRDVVGAPLIARLVAGEDLDVTAIVRDGDAGDIAVPHPVAAVLQSGDVVRVDLPGASVRLAVDEIDTADAGVVLTAPVAGDQTNALLSLLSTPGRLVVEDASSWPGGFEVGEPIRVDYLDLTGAGAAWTTTVAWSDPASGTIWPAAAPPPPPWRRWTAVSSTIVVRATDRGRYLWLRLTLYGKRADRGDPAATATPTVHAVRVLAPRHSSLRLLPQVYARRDDDDPSGAIFLERFLALCDAQLTTVEERYEDVARELDPFAASPDWLRFLGGWFGLVFDPSWPDDRRALLVSEAFSLFRARGTIAGISRFIEIYTGRTPTIVEGFQVRPRPGLIIGGEATLGCAPLGGLDLGAANASDLLAAYAHRFTVYVDAADDTERAVLEPVIRTIVDATRPAHTLATVVVTTPTARVGLASTVGLDLVVGGEPPPAPPLGQSVIGRDAALTGRRATDAVPLDGITPTVGSFTLR